MYWWDLGGTTSCANMNIYRSSNVYILGTSDPVRGTSIYSNGIGLLCVYLMSQGAGDTLSVYCNNNDTCYIECGPGAACSSGTGTTIYCQSEATCLVKCNVTIGLDCPHIMEGNYTIVNGPPKDIDSLVPSILPTTVPIPTAIPNTIPTYVPSSTNMTSATGIAKLKTTLSQSANTSGPVTSGNVQLYDWFMYT